MSFSTRFNDRSGAIGFAATYGGSGALLAAGYLGYTGEVMSALPVALIGLALLVGRAASLEVDVRGRATGPVAKRVATVAVVALVLSTAALSGVFGPASPVETASAEWVECDITDSVIGAAYNTMIGATEGCRWEEGDVTDYENQSATDGYATALSIQHSQESYLAQTNNFAENSRTVAYSKGKITLINELNNETSPAIAKNEINKTVDNYYSRVIAGVVDDWNAKAWQAHYLDNSSSVNIVEGEASDQYDGNPWSDDDTYGYYSITLPNGTEKDVVALEGAGNDYHWTIRGNAGSLIVGADDPDTGTRTTFLNASKYEQTIADLEAQAEQVKENLAPYTDEVYNQYQAGEIDSTDLAANDPTVIAAEASTDFESTGYYSYANIQLAAIGASGNVNVSHKLTTGDGTTLNGSLFYTADDAPSEGWKTGETYNLSSFNGTFYMTVQKDDGNGTIVDLSNYGDNFTINEATNTDTGEEVEATKVQTYTYDSTNASNLQEEIDRLEQLRQEYEDVGAQGGGTGCVAACGDGSSILPAETGLYVVLGLAAIILLARP